MLFPPSVASSCFFLLLASCFLLLASCFLLSSRFLFPASSVFLMCLDDGHFKARLRLVWTQPRRLFKARRPPSYDVLLAAEPLWRRKLRPAADIPAMLKDVQLMRPRFGERAVADCVKWINCIDSTTWTDVPLHWGAAGRLRPAGPLPAPPVGRGDDRKEAKRAAALAGAPAPGVVPRSQVAVGGSVAYRCIDSNLTFHVGDMVVVNPEEGLQMVSDENRLLRFGVGRIVSQDRGGSRKIHWLLCLHLLHSIVLPLTAVP